MYIDPSQYQQDSDAWNSPAASPMGGYWDPVIDTMKSTFDWMHPQPLLGGSDGGGLLGGVSGGIDRALGGLLGDAGEPDWAAALPNHGGYGRDPGDIGVY